PVDVAVHVHVDGVGAAGGHGAAPDGRRDEPQRGQAALGHDHGGDRGDEEELDDARLGQGDVGPDPCAPREPGSGHVEQARSAPPSAANPRRGAETAAEPAGGTPPEVRSLGSVRRLLARVRAPISPEAYRRITLVALFFLGAIIVTGAAVRLTGSGMGCPTWPSCEDGSLAPRGATGHHGWIEFLNRLVTGVVSVAVALAVLGAHR